MPSASSVLQPFQLLEVNIISAQDLAPVSRTMRTYAVAWIHPDRKLSTRVDTLSHTNPTWNDKFVFRVDEAFLYGDTSAIMIELYAQHWFKDIHVGTVRVMVGNVVPPRTHLQPKTPHRRHVGMRFVALQVRRPSGRPQGILNLGVTVLDSSMRSMPLYNQLGSAVGYHDIMGASPPQSDVEESDVNYFNNDNIPVLVGALRRTRSDTSSMVSDVITRRIVMQGNDKAGSVVGGSEVGFTAKNGKPSSVVSQAKKRKGGSIVNGSHFTTNVKRNKGGSIINGSEIVGPTKTRGPTSSIILGSDVVGPQKRGKQFMTESEVGPSPSELTTAYRRPLEGGSVILGAGEEGLRSKLERWRAELPAMYDRGSEYTGYTSNPRVGDREQGLFSCFGKICGVECSIVCGGNASQSGRKRDISRRHIRSFSDDLSYV